ncbi:MAG: GAF domain-containing sensor histidine kinase [Chloroflexi bacterium]|nr:GAF domain-containing sensor histidine kinase [Chloroflexota bacterium]
MDYQSAANGQSHEETRQRLAESRSLQRVTTALLQKLTLDQVFEIVRCEARELTGAAGGSIFLLEEDSWLREASHDVSLDPLSARIPVSGTLTGQAVLSGKPILDNAYSNGAVEARTPNVKTESLLSVPLQIEGNSIGALNVANKVGGFTENDVHILGLLADVAAIAIENARLREKAKQLAIVEERQWLARELHDSVTQAMYSVTLYAEATRLALAAGKSDVAAENLQELQMMAREALFSIRLLIFELHPPILEGQGLVAALQVRLSAVESRAGLQTELRVEKSRRLPLAIEEELYRIALEALNNVVKHARAQHVTVTVKFDDDRVYLEVTDDGKGYDSAVARGSGGMGLRGMEERAQRINAKLEMVSAPGMGTTLKVEVLA